MRRFMRFSVVLCLLAFVMSMSFMFVPPIESHAADGEVGVFYYGFTDLEGGGRKLVLSPVKTDVAENQVKQTSSEKTVPWVDLTDTQHNDLQTKEVDIEGPIFPYYISFAKMGLFNHN